MLSQMPESKQIESDLKAYNTQLEAQLKSKMAEYETKAEAYQKGAATMTEWWGRQAERDADLQRSIQEFQRSADKSLQQKQQTLLKPALDKLQKNIDAVADENGYTYVFNSDGASPCCCTAQRRRHFGHGAEENGYHAWCRSGCSCNRTGCYAAAKPAAAPAGTKPKK